MKKRRKSRKVSKIIFSILIIILFVAAGIHYNQTVNNKPKIVQPKPVTDKLTITLFFRDSENLVGEQREITISQDEDIPKRVIEELIKGPQNSNLSATIPIGTKINSIEVNGNIATVDLSREFIENHYGGSEAENLTIYSVVNTLTELININKVEFLIDGQIRTVFKHFTLNDIFTKDKSLIKY